MSLKDVMSPELRENLIMHRKYALSIFRALRSGDMDKQEAAEGFMDVYECLCIRESWEWLTGQCDYDVYGDAHPCRVFETRLILSAIILEGEDRIKCKYPYMG